ncbi:hypothetical protein FEE95_09830 [Maribacter algarum]|uniref:DUF1436 family protein n=1 Tax=Maribacter algarum (ex Zhang et al. 2020) TaxID=2578118 RepID=A0A5S3PQ58_9FLAO|nr:hypothetical protein [Maribacter algarum]TMM56791.1 hypothetical protein FEE95_09830 [Maribacter algarum]
MNIKTRYLIFKILFKQNFRAFVSKLPWKRKRLTKWERVNLIDFPQFYIITTVHTVKDNGGIYSENITRLDKDVDFLNLENKVLRHLDDSIWHIKQDFARNWYRKVGELTNQKNVNRLLKNSKMVSINRNNQFLEINSTINRGSGKYDFKKKSIRLNLPINSGELYDGIEEALSACNKL